MELAFEDRVGAIRAAKIFANLSDNDLETLAGQMEPEVAAPGQVICRQGEPAETFYVVVDGSLEVTQDGGTVGSLGHGDVFGEMSLVDGGPATATVAADSESVMLRMSKDDFQQSIRARELIALPLLMVMTERIRQNDRAATERQGSSS